MFCVYCGKELSERANFCPNCGHPVIQIDAESQVQVQPTQVNPAQDAPVVENPGEVLSSSSSRKWYIALGCMAGLVLIIGVILVEVLINRNSGVNQAAGGTEAMDSEKGTEAYEEGETDDGTVLLASDTKEGQLQREILKMNSSSYQEQTIDVYDIKREPGKRNTSYSWNDKTFYTLEGYKDDDIYVNKNLCTLVKKELVNKATGNIMEYEVYINPGDHIANKIVSIEYLTDGIEVTEYYYDKNKKPNFVFQYQTDNYVSTYATPDKKGQRFLFHNDCLVTWRNVTAHGTKNLAVGKNEYRRLEKSWSQNTLYQYSSLNTDKKRQFDKIEKRMLNAAYNTYETVMNAEGFSIIQGYVYDEKESGMSGATVELYDENNEELLFSTVTDADGAYHVYVPYEDYDYNMCVLKNGYDSCEIYDVGVSNEQIGVYQDGIFLFRTDASEAYVNLRLGDAFNYNSSGTGMVSLSEADVNIRKGINNRNGSQIVFSGTTDENGYIQIVLEPGAYTLEVLMPGYETMYYTIIANPILNNDYEFYASPELADGEYAVVLTWGENPCDLDSHLFTTKGTNSSHVWFGGMEDGFGNCLDVDDTDSYGPETISIDSLSSTDYYKYCVVDFTDCNEDNLRSYDMSCSQATVNVYSSEGWVKTFHVPTNRQGVIWEVFEIRNGKLTPIQRYYDNVDNKDWWHQDK